jgi:mannose-1-phosphate guanylyltransferase
VSGVEAVLLVGGLGTRLRPLTLRCPKPMLPVAGVPFVAHQLARASAAGVTRVVLATAYRPQVFAQLGDRSTWGVELVLVTEDEPLGTGGAIANAGTALTSGADEPVVILNGDVLSGHDLAAQLAMHESSGADVTLHLVEVADARAFGSVPTDPSGRVTAFLEKSPNPPTNQINAGCYVFRRSVIDAIPVGRVVSVERETFPGLLAAGAVVQGYVETAYWLDLGNPAALVQGSADVVRGVLPSTALPGPVGEVLVLDGASVAEDAEVSGGSVVGAGASIGAGAVVESSVLQAGAVVKAGAVVRRSVVGVDAVVGERTRVEDAVVGDGAVVGADNELVGGARVWVDVTLPDKSIRVSSDA